MARFNARRKNRLIKPAVAFTGAALLVGAIGGTYKIIGTAEPVNEPNLLVQNVAATPVTPTAIKPGSFTPSAIKPAVLPKPSPAMKPLQARAVVDVAPQPAARPSVESGTAISAASVFEQADAKIKSDDLLAARKLLVDAIDNARLSDTDKDQALQRVSRINETVVFSVRKFNSDPFAEQHLVKPGESLQKIAKNYDVPWQFIGRLNNITDPRKLQAGRTLKVVRGPINALVSKTHFTLDLYIGTPTQPGAVLLKRLRVGLGESDSTPTGVWAVSTKLENPRYYNPRNDGPRIIEPDDPKNPLGERWIALEGRSGQAVGKISYGIHGTIEPESIGQKKSMGCIRMLNEDVELVYDMLAPGKSTVTVVE